MSESTEGPEIVTTELGKRLFQERLAEMRRQGHPVKEPRWVIREDTPTEVETREKLRARWEADLAKVPPELAEQIRNLPPLSEHQVEAIRRILFPGMIPGTGLNDRDQPGVDR
jgi:hypothetical protein